MVRFSADPILDTFIEQLYARLVSRRMVPLPESFKEIPYGVAFKVITTREEEVPVAVYHSEKKGVSIVTPHEGIRCIALALLVPEPTVGCDEAGKGDIFGPLCAACFYLCDDSQGALSLGVRDSKRMSDAEVLAADKELHRYRRWFEVVRIMPKRYNELYAEFQKKGWKLNHILTWAHSKALANLSQRHSAISKIVVDQFSDDPSLIAVVRSAVPQAEVEFRPRAESHPAVALASVVARADYLKALKKLSEDILKGELALKSGSGTDADTLITAIRERYGEAIFSDIAKQHFANFSRT